MILIIFEASHDLKFVECKFLKQGPRQQIGHIALGVVAFWFHFISKLLIILQELSDTIVVYVTILRLRHFQ